MRFVATNNWHKPEELEGLLFFSQRMNELLFDYTLDSHKPKVMNAPALAKEALRALEDIRAGHISEANITHILEELVHVLKSDKISGNLLNLSVDEYHLKADLSKNGVANHRQLKTNLELVGKELHPRHYLLATQQFIRSSILQNKKMDIDFGASSYVTFLLNEGMSQPYIYGVVSNFFADREINSNDVLDELFSELAFHFHNAKVYFVVSDLVEDIDSSLGKFACKILYEIPDELLDTGVERVLKTTRKQVILEVSEVPATDTHKARTIAESQLAWIADLYSLFHHKTKITWKEKAVVVLQCCSDNPVIADKETNIILRGPDLKRGKAARQFTEFIDNFSLIHQGEEKSTFNSMVSLHSASLSTRIPSNQFLNIWIALEAIVPENLHKNKITNIVDQVSPLLANNYVWKLTRAFALDLARYDRNFLKQQLSDDSALSLQEKCLHLLAIDSNDGLREQLYSRLDAFPLLRYRAWCLAQQLKSPKHAMSFIRTHMQRVEWQLRRLYRTRNLIVHSGKKVSRIEPLVENAHSYLDTITNVTMRLSCGRRDLDTFEQVFAYSSLSFNRLEVGLSSNKEWNPNLLSRLLNSPTF